MRRLRGLYKEYDVVGLTEDVPDANLKKGDIRTIMGITIPRGLQLAELFIELSDACCEEEDPCRYLEIYEGILPPLEIISSWPEGQRDCDTFNVYPDDRKYIQILG